MIEGLLQPTHLILILAIILIVFGAGKLPEIGSAVGKGIREFKTEVQVPEGTAEAVEAPQAPQLMQSTTTQATSAGNFCGNCGKPLGPAARFCAACGTQVVAQG